RLKLPAKLWQFRDPATTLSAGLRESDARRYLATRQSGVVRRQTASAGENRNVRPTPLPAHARAWRPSTHGRIIRSIRTFCRGSNYGFPSPNATAAQPANQPKAVAAQSGPSFVAALVGRGARRAAVDGRADRQSRRRAVSRISGQLLSADACQLRGHQLFVG